MLHIAAGHFGNSFILLKLFLHHRPTVNARNSEGWMLLHEAAYSGNLECMEQLVGHGPDVNAVTDDGLSVLHVAKLQKHKDCVACLLDIGADHNSATHYRTLRNCLQMQHDANYSGCSGTRYSNNFRIWHLLLALLS